MNDTAVYKPVNNNYIVRKVFISLLSIYILSELARKLGAFVDSVLVGKLMDSVSHSFFAALAVSVFLTFVLLLFSSSIAELLGAKDALHFYAVCFIPYLINILIARYYQGTGEISLANTMFTFEGTILIILFVLILSPLFNVRGVWLAFILAEVFSWFVPFVFIAIRNKRLPCYADLLCLENKFKTPESRILSFSLGNHIEEVVNISEIVDEFCSKNNIDKRRSSIISLCIEEMAGNIITHNFASQQKKFLDIRIVIKNEEIIFRLRDNGSPFNPVKYVESHKSEDPAANIGIKITMKMVQDFSYYYVARMNNLVIKI